MLSRQNDGDLPKPGISHSFERAVRSLMRNVLRWLQPIVPEASFVTFHYIYFIATCLIASLIFWGSSTPARSVRYIDSVFLTVSAMTEAGLNTVNLSELNTWQQIILFFLIIMGSAIFVSGAVINIRKRAFETKLQQLADRRQKRLLRSRSLTMTFTKTKRRLSRSGGQREAEIASGAVRGRPIPSPDPTAEYVPTFPARSQSTGPRVEEPKLEEAAVAPHPPQTSGSHIQFAEPADRPNTNVSNSVYNRHRRSLFTNSGVGAHSFGLHPRHSGPSQDYPAIDEEAIIDEPEEKPRQPNLQQHPKLDKYIQSVNGYIGRNSQFHALTEEERRELGGIEYDALCVLSYVVPMYFIMFQLFGAIGCGAWMRANRPGAARINGLNPFWTGAFFAISAFNNSGMALLDANATALQTSYYMLLTLSLLILAGNTCFPPFLRLIIWAMRKCTPGTEYWKSSRLTLQFILDHPRRVYTNLFPADATWWLVGSLVLLNGIDWFAFEVLNIGNPTLSSIPLRFRVIDGLFQAFAVRAGGFYVVSIAGLYPGTLVLYVLMMYLSAFPVTMTIRNTNVYEERSLAIFADDPSAASQPKPRKIIGNRHERNLSRTRTGLMKTLSLAHGGTNQAAQSSWSRQDFVRQQFRGQLGHDLWWLGLAVLLITIIETSQFLRDPVNFSIFNTIFEVVSAYGTVGISVGVPWNAYSFCGAWHTGSKLILCAVMLRGRHRGLPVAIDRAILLPDHTLSWAEEEDGRARRGRSSSMNLASRAPSTSRSGGLQNGDANALTSDAV